MELWIRSQDENNLIKVYDIWVDDTDRVDKGYVSIMANSDFSFELGAYETKARAQEVLDEIQNILMPKCIINSKSMKFSEPYEKNGIVLMDCNADARIEQLPTYVYEMPKE